MRARSLFILLAPLFACSDFDCPDGQMRVEGACEPANAGPVDPEPKTRTIPLACDSTLNPQDGVGWGWWTWQLTVNPTPIASGGEFSAELGGVAVFPEFFMKQAQEILGGMTRVEPIDLHATVRVRRGAVKAEPVLLTLDRDLLPWTCRYDGNGEEVSEEKNFPPCSVDNDNPDGSNEDCVGLGGVSNPANYCRQFIPIPTSFDCEPGGACDTVVYENPGLGWDAMRACEENGFCVTGPVVVALKPDSPSLLYEADESGHVLFGWDDVTTGAELDQSGGPNDGTLVLREANFDDFQASNGIRVIARGIQAALACTMAAGGWGVFGVNSRDDRPSPAPDHMLISFPIQEP